MRRVRLSPQGLSTPIVITCQHELSCDAIAELGKLGLARAPAINIPRRTSQAASWAWSNETAGFRWEELVFRAYIPIAESSAGKISALTSLTKKSNRMSTILCSSLMPRYGVWPLAMTQGRCKRQARDAHLDLATQRFGNPTFYRCKQNQPSSNGSATLKPRM